MHHFFSLHHKLLDDTSPSLDAFGRVLFLTILTLGVMLVDPIWSSTQGSQHTIGSGIVSLLVGLTLIASVRAAGVTKKIRNAITIFIALGLLASFSVILFDFLRSDSLFVKGFSGINPVWVVLAALTPIAGTVRLLKHKQVTLNTLAAAISSYLQIALAFALIFLYIDANTVTHLLGEPVSSEIFTYFSLVTITTVGYGDFSAVTDLGRAFSVLEAVLGQIYLVTLVAMLVGLYTSNREN